MRLLIANEPKAYRDVLEKSLTVLRPHLQIMTTEPVRLVPLATSFLPHLVICSELPPAVQPSPLGWIILYPDGERRVIVTIAGRSATVPDLELDQLLAIIDEIERRLAQMS